MKKKKSAAAFKENIKNNIYKSYLDHYKFYPFILETYGSLGDKSIEFLNLIFNSLYKPFNAHDFDNIKIWFYSNLSILLMKYNAKIINFNSSFD